MFRDNYSPAIQNPNWPSISENLSRPRCNEVVAVSIAVDSQASNEDQSKLACAGMVARFASAEMQDTDADIQCSAILTLIVRPCLHSSLSVCAWAVARIAPFAGNVVACQAAVRIRSPRDASAVAAKAGHSAVNARRTRNMSYVSETVQNVVRHAWPQKNNSKHTCAGTLNFESAE